MFRTFKKCVRSPVKNLVYIMKFNYAILYLLIGIAIGFTLAFVVLPFSAYSTEFSKFQKFQHGISNNEESSKSKDFAHDEHSHDEKGLDAKPEAFHKEELEHLFHKKGKNYKK